MQSTSVYIGIDVACAARKRLPLCIVAAGFPLIPLTIPKHLSALIPRGVGNREITSPVPFEESARGTVSAISRISDEMGWNVERVAIDAPAAPPAKGSRASEEELGRLSLSSFRTPPAAAWAGIRDKCISHLDCGGTASTLPHANMIWMLFGFQLFAQLRNDPNADVIEVYPFAIVRTLLPKCKHKSTEQGYQDQLCAVALRTGWEPRALEAKLKSTVSGSRHDRLDAYMAAWVASLPSVGRRAFGDSEKIDDAIWVPL